MAKFKYQINNGPFPLPGSVVTIDVPNQDHADIAIYAALNQICIDRGVVAPDKWDVRQLPRDN